MGNKMKTKSWKSVQKTNCFFLLFQEDSKPLISIDSYKNIILQNNKKNKERFRFLHDFIVLIGLEIGDTETVSELMEK